MRPGVWRLDALRAEAGVVRFDADDGAAAPPLPRGVGAGEAAFALAWLRGDVRAFNGARACIFACFSFSFSSASSSFASPFASSLGTFGDRVDRFFCSDAGASTRRFGDGT